MEDVDAELTTPPPATAYITHGFAFAVLDLPEAAVHADVGSSVELPFRVIDRHGEACERVSAVQINGTCAAARTADLRSGGGRGERSRLQSLFS